MTSADILSPAQVKRWLLSCYRPIHWHDLCEVGTAFKEIDLCLRRINFNDEAGYLELRFYADRIGTYEELHAGLYRIAKRHGGQLVDYRVEVERNVQRLQVDVLHTMDYRGPEYIEVIVRVIPPSPRPTTIYRQIMVARAAEHARVFGQGRYPLVVDYRPQGRNDPDRDY